MQIADFLHRTLSPKAAPLMAYESGILTHFDAYLQQIWPAGRVLIAVESAYRGYAEQKLLPALKVHGFEPVYCLCMREAGVTYRNQIEDALGDGAVNGMVGMAALGGNGVFSAVREMASSIDVACCALFNELMPRNGLDVCGERPCADAFFFDLDAIIDGCHGDFRDAVQNLEVMLYAMKADMAAANAAGERVDAVVSEAISEAMPPRLSRVDKVDEDEAAQICEAYVWCAAARRVRQAPGSFESVLAYAGACRDIPDFSAAQHAGVMAAIFDAALELESLEISPEDCAAKQPPKEVLNRTLQQILLEDGISFEWIKGVPFMDRTALRLQLHSVMMNWDDLGAKLRPISDMMHAIAAQSLQDEDEFDSRLVSLWTNAGYFAPKNTFLRLFHDMRVVESALYL